MRGLVMVIACVACGGSTPITPPVPEAVPEAVLDPSTAPAPTTTTNGCITAGDYNVALDLESAKLSQGNTGMADTTWCKSMLAGVAAQAMSAMTVRYDGAALQIEWPPGHPATFDASGSCQLSITSPPMPAQLTFGSDGATGTTTFTVGTQHDGDTCTATDAKLVLSRAK